ncbi:MAG: zf-HC2 domain-containing protein [Planctomycetes bacterium]|nr:zf-HC2 domain-containing protein [Planctomycetota bacterium]
MNCEETRRHWDLYHDSEGDGELYLQVNQHLAECPACAKWFYEQSRLEDVLVEKLRGGPKTSPTPELWNSVLAKAGVVEAPRSLARSCLFFLGGGLAVAASVLIAVFVLSRGSDLHAGPSLSQLTAQHHQSFAQGQQAADFASRSDLDVEAYLQRRVAFPVRCPPRQDTGFFVQGAGVCRLERSEAAYLVGEVDGASVSIFLLPSDSLRRFPHQYQALQREYTHRCREGKYEMIMAQIDGSVVLVVGQVDPGRLQRVLRAYGSYPHAVST